MGRRPAASRPDSIYADQWLFHGPALQAVVGIGPISLDGIEGTLRVLPLASLLREGEDAGQFLTDPIILDNFTHLLGGWGLDRLADDGDVIFPLGMEELAIFGESPAEGPDVDLPDRDPGDGAAPGPGRGRDRPSRWPDSGC